MATRNRQVPEKQPYTGNGALSAVFQPGAPSKPFYIKQITVKNSAAPTTSENLVAQLDSSLGSVHDRKLVNEDLQGVEDAEYPVDGYFEAGSKVNLTYTNTDAVIYGIIVEWYYTA